MLPPELIRYALVFLQRVDIKGAEAMAMVQVCQALETMARQDGMRQHTPLAQHGNGTTLVEEQPDA